MDYKKAGVDIEAGYRSVELMKEYVKKTMRPEVLGGLGGFSGAFSLAAIKDMEKPVLVSGTDGVGTKLKLAFLMDQHDTVGIDCVAMCVNDIAWELQEKAPAIARSRVDFPLPFSPTIPRIPPFFTEKETCFMASKASFFSFFRNKLSFTVMSFSIL